MSDRPGMNALGGDVVWMGTQPPMSPEEARNALVGATGVPDIRAGVNALTRGEILPGIGQTGVGLAQLGSLAYPAGRVAGRVLGEAIPAIPRVLGDVSGAFTVYHGTPHTFKPVEGNPFGQFTNEAVGTGEGAQAYGWGHYVAGSPKTAEKYQTSGESGTGNLLEIHVLPHEHELLDWDKPLSEQESGVQEALKPVLSNMQRFRGHVTDPAGQDIYQDLSRNYSKGFAGPRYASRALHDAGIPGIKYLDAGSRGKPETTYITSEFPNQHGINFAPREFNSRAEAESYIRDQWQELGPKLTNDWISSNITPKQNSPQTYNYVIFDPSNLRIVARNGQRLEPIDHNPFQSPSDALGEKLKSLEDARLTREGLLPDEFDRPNFFQNLLGKGSP